MKHMTEAKKQQFLLAIFFSVVIFAVELFTILFTAGLSLLLVHLGVIPERTSIIPNNLILLMSLFSIVIGAAAAFLTAKFPLRPVTKLVGAMNRLASGDFSVRLHYKRPLAENATFKSIADSFNTLATELGNTAMLQGDFINNFSHEFKTPIVSITGFAKLLRHGNLTEAEREEYLAIIEEESMRLSCMATNVLNLSRIENQTILTGVAEYDLSEQIRGAILLLEDKWTRKNIDIEPEFDEHMICANEELLKEVWINLMDNAIKFTPEGGVVMLRIAEKDGWIRVSVRNTGSEIPQEKQAKIFDRFYQADESHGTDGNGIGLTVVKKIVDLHGGTVAVSSASGITDFTVTLPARGK